MPETTCSGCGRQLRIAEEHAGKRAKCPLCGAMTEAVAADEAAVTDLELPPVWSLKTPEGRIYGPVDEVRLEQWVRQGRVTDACMIRFSDQPWREAAERFPILGEPIARVVTAELAAPVPSVEPHRGGVILALGIVSWIVICPVFGAFAWVLGTRDLNQMRAEWMDPQGAGMTQAGQVLGMVNCVVAAICLIIGMFVWLASLI